MDGSINFVGSLNGSIDKGGGGGGNVYDVKVKTSLNYESVVDENDKTAYIDLSGYATKSELSGFVTSEALTTILGDYVTDSELSTALSDYVTDSELSMELTNYQPKLTAGENITINPITNVISASGGGGSWNYSTNEVDTGQKWTDNKNLFVKTFQGQLTISTNNRTWYDLISNLSYMDKVFVMPESYIELSDAIINIPYTSYFNNVGAVVGANFDTPTHTFQLLIGGLPTGTYDYEITLKYTKSI